MPRFRGHAPAAAATVMAIAIATGHHLLLALALALLPLAAQAQQEYQGNAQSDCHNTTASAVLGYTCTTSTSPAACATYMAFRSAAPTYASPIAVAYLLNASAPSIAAANSIPVAASVRNNTLLLVPVPCACTAAGRYQHAAAYAVQSDETYFSVASETYQGLSTCQALMAHNPAHGENDLYPGVNLTVPLRCACPSPAQTAAGVRFLVTYVLDWDDYAYTVAERFRADYQALLDANGIADDTTVYPFTTLLVPLKDPPSSGTAPGVLTEPPTPSSAPSDMIPPASSLESSSSRWWIAAGVVLALGAVLALFLLWRWCWRTKKTTPSVAPAKGDFMWPAVELEPADVRKAVWSLTVYVYRDLERATSGFSEEQRIGNSSVYRAVLNGGAAAVKRVPGEVGAEAEVSVLGRVNHSSLIGLTGLCIHGGYTFMVFEFAENGALSDWLHVHADAGEVLRWSQRVQVALDVAGGLNYLHNYTDPPYVHKNLKTSNILLDACFRAKLSNFGLALAITGDAEDGDDQWMTRHVVGTQGYLAPEYLEHGLIGPQLDVFAFGVVLLELLSGKEAATALDGDGDGGGMNDGKVLLLWEEAEQLGDGDGANDDLLDRVTAFIDGRPDEQYPMDVALAMLALALRCVAREPRARPSMAAVLLSLSGMHNWTLNWDPRCPQPQFAGASPAREL